MITRETTVPLGKVDCARLIEKVRAVPEEFWSADGRRQNEFDVHAQTQSIIVKFCEGWPDIAISTGEGWSLLGSAVEPVIDEIVARHYPAGGRVLRVIIARLPAGCRIARHKDVHPSFSIAHRIHVPLVTNPAVDFTVGTERVPPRVGFAFELNNLMLHQVVNHGSEDRIHLIFDYAPPTVAAARH